MVGESGRCRIRWLARGCCLASAIFPIQPVSPQGAPTIAPSIGVNLNLLPKRVVLDRGARSATIYAINRGDTATTFDVSLVDRVMMPDGQIRTVDQANSTEDGKAIASRLSSAHDFVIVTPRRITLAPGKGQTIRLRALPPAAGGAAEYRTHLTVANVPPPDTGLTAEEVASRQSGQLFFRVRSVVAISIPVIVRTAPADVKARLEEPRITTLDIPAEGGGTRRVQALSIQIARGAPSSLFGNVEVRAGSKGEESLGNARGVGVYPEITTRSIQIMLKRAPRKGEKLLVTFTDDDVHPGTELARTSFEAP